MGKYVSIKDNQRKIKKSLRNLEKLYGSKLKIGVVGEDNSEQVMIASVHEFGIRIQVTDKMRGWFAWKGYPLNPKTTEIKIPERSYIRKTFDSKKDKIREAGNEMIVKVVKGDMSAEIFLKKLGVQLVSLVRETIDNIENPPLSGMTKDMRKGSGEEASPLQDTGKLWQSITYEIEW